MIKLNWQPLVQKLKVPAHPAEGVWIQAMEYAIGPKKLKIVASGKWDIVNGSKSVGPEGDLEDWDSGTTLLLPGVPRGSMIAKIGGGTADKQGAFYPIGQFSIIELLDPAIPGTQVVPRGAFFLTMNDEPRCFVGHSGALLVDIWEAC